MSNEQYKETEAKLLEEYSKATTKNHRQELEAKLKFLRDIYRKESS